MQYIKHNFIKNMDAFVKYNEPELLQDMFLDEIVKVYVFDRNSLDKVILNNNYTFIGNPNKYDYLKFFKQSILNNPKFRNDLANLIVINNSKTKDIQNKEVFDSFDGKKIKVNEYSYSDTKEKKSKEDIKHERDFLSKSMYSNFTDNEIDEDIFSNKAYQHTRNKLEMEEQLVTKEDLAEELKKAIRGAYIKSAFITSVVLIGGFYAFKYFANKYYGGSDEDYSSTAPIQPSGIAPSQETMATGGEVPASNDGFDEYGFAIER